MAVPTLAAAAAAAKLAIAKASLSAALLRADPEPCAREDIDSFHALLGSATTRCSPENVQACKRWILAHVAHAEARTAALGKYLAALSATLKKGTGKQPSDRRQRLYLLYVLSDTVFHAATRDHNDGFARGFEPFVVQLVRSAASFSGAPKQLRKIRSLLDFWSDKALFSPETLAKLRTAVDEGTAEADQKKKQGQEDGKTAEAAKAVISQDEPKIDTKRQEPFVLPAVHGNHSMPWYDQPAGTWLSVMRPNSTRPMNPMLIQPMPMHQGPAPEALADSVRRLLVDVDRMYGEENKENRDGQAKTVLDINNMGERIKRDAATGEIIEGDTYYGWSRGFCEKMRARKQQSKAPKESHEAFPDEEEQEWQQQQQEQEQNRDPHGKQRRYSLSEVSSHGHSHDRSRDRSRDRDRGRLRRRSRSRSRHSDSHDSPEGSSRAHKRRRMGSQQRRDEASRNRRGRSRSASSRLHVPGQHSHDRRRSASPSRHRDERQRSYHRDRSWSRSRSRSHSPRSPPYSPVADDRDRRSSRRPHRRSRSQSPRHAKKERYNPSPQMPQGGFGQPYGYNNNNNNNNNNGPLLAHSSPLMPIPFPPGVGFPGGIPPPPPPPPPPNYNGPWPPPLPFSHPPLAPRSMHASGTGGWDGWMPQPPPPPPPQWPPNAYPPQQGRGWNGPRR